MGHMSNVRTHIYVNTHILSKESLLQFANVYCIGVLINFPLTVYL